MPLFRHLSDAHFYRCTMMGRDAEDCWQIGPLCLTYRPVWLWRHHGWGVEQCSDELAVDTPWVSVLWLP
jgi:hypothetical protein